MKDEEKIAENCRRGIQIGFNGQTKNLFALHICGGL